jgi:hypothetical protein
MMACWISRLWLIRHADEYGATPPARLARHLAGCAACRARRETHHRLATRLAASVPRREPPPFLAARIVAAARAAAPRRPAVSFRRLRWAGAAMIALTAGLSLWLAIRPAKTPRPVAPPLELAALVRETISQPMQLADRQRLAVVTRSLAQPLEQEWRRLQADADSAWHTLAADFTPSPAAP